MPEDNEGLNGAVVAAFFLMLLLISLPTFGPSEKVWPSLTKFGWWWLLLAFSRIEDGAVVAPSVKSSHWSTSSLVHWSR